MKCVKLSFSSLFFKANMGYTDELDVSSEDDYEFDQWVHGPSNSRRYPRPSDRNNDRGLSGNYTGSPSSADRLPLTYYTAASDRLPPLSVKVQAKESVSSLLLSHSCEVSCLHHIK